MLFNKMKLSLRIPLTLTVVVAIAGIVIFIRNSTRGGSLPTSDFIIWGVAMVLLIGISIGSWLRNKKKSKSL
jgi:uncharacterized membrane protein YfcA